MIRSAPNSDFCHRPWDTRFVNWLGPILQRLRLTPARRGPEALRDLGCRRLTEEQWGHESFRQSFCVLLQTISKDFDLSYAGWRKLRGILVSHLLNRIAVCDHLQHHPEILRQPIRRPLVVTGLPRSGSTVLQRLLAADPACSGLVFWKACRPVPPSPAVAPERDPRLAESERFLRWLHRHAPRYSAIHPMHPQYPEECTLLLMNTFVSGAFRLYGPCRRHFDWLARIDKIPAYRDYRRQLQLLQYYDPGKRWVLKAPDHLPNLDALLAVFPDACIVQTHRDPVKVVPSACSLIATMRGMLSDRIDLRRIGAERLFGHAGMLNRSISLRDQANPAQFFDVHFNELLHNPVGVVRRIYDYFHFPYTEAFERRMRTWLVEHRRNKHGRHRYSLEQFGLTPHQVREYFADYYRRYGVEPDGKPTCRAKAACLRPSLRCGLEAPTRSA